MKILITGGAGFIGSNLVAYLIEQPEVDQITIYDNLSECSIGHIEEITNIHFNDREGSKKEKIQANGKNITIELIINDILNSDVLNSVSKNIDAIIHLAAHTRVVKSVENPKDAFNININGTINVLECARLNNVKNVIIKSSNAAVGETVTPINENIFPQPISPYGASKLCGEALGSAYAKCYGITVTALRFANAYGLYSEYKTSVIAKMLKDILNGNDLIIYGDGEQTRDFINATDIAYAIWLALNRKGGFEVFQVASGKEVSINKLVEIICSVTGINPNVTHAPERIGEIKRNFSNIDKIQKVLGFEPKVELEEGIRNLYQHFLKSINKTTL